MTTPYLGIGPSNFAGQAHTWAKGVEQHLGVPADSFNRGPIKRGEFRFETDRVIPAPLYFLPVLRHQRMKGFLRRYSHVAIDGYSTLFQLRNRRDLGADARYLGEQGFQMALIAHGGDIRDPATHMARNKWSLYREADDEWIAWRQRATDDNRKLAADSGLPLFVSTPDLLHDQPTATWLPICIDPARFATDQPVMERERPRVLHMPSKRTPPIKGSQYIDPVLTRLDAEGLVEYVAPSHMPHSEVPAMMAGVDIVIDQLLASSYGVTALEAMAAGRVTVGAVGDETAALMPERPPLVEATPDDLEDVIRGLVADRDAARETAAHGGAFVRRWHDGRHSANQMAAYLGVDPVEIH